MILSKACTYGILAALYVAKETGKAGVFVSIREMSEDLNISFHFLTKILQKLTSAGVLKSMKGPKGGVAFTRDPHELTILDVVLAIDGREIFTECVLGLPGCGNEKPCPIHEYWAEAREELREMFQSKTLGETAHDVKELKLRLSLPKEADNL